MPSRVSWRAVAAMRAWSDRTSAVARQDNPIAAAWGDTQYLLAIVADEVRWQSYALAKQGGNDATPPLPLDRPGQKSIDRNQIAGAAMTLEQTKEWLGW